ncbi:MAG TPA: anti-sigma factor [Solirubrobacteraceae bacterium]|jgi:hypothetical protein|nr:anti-sigma factor [Solirubrobacteraceae bacterium]
MTTWESDCDHTHDAALYVLGELHGLQLEAFARHLRSCDQCTEEVELLQGAADAVPLLAARHIPVESIAEQEPVRRAPALVASIAQAQAATERQREHFESRRPSLRTILGGVSAAQPPTPPSSSRGRLRLLRTPMPKPAALGILLLGIIAAITIALSHQAATIHYVTVKAGWTDGGAALQLEGTKLELLVEGMPQPATGNGYQVWVLDKGSKQLRPTSVWLNLNGAGQAGVKVPGNYGNWEALAVYVEPLSGRHTTKSGAVVVADLRNQH